MSDVPRVSIPLTQYESLCDAARKTQELERQLHAMRLAFEDMRAALDGKNVEMFT